MRASNVLRLPPGAQPSRPANPEPVQWLTREEAAARLGVSVRTIRRWNDTGVLGPVLKLGKIVRIPARALAELESRLLADESHGPR